MVRRKTLAEELAELATTAPTQGNLNAAERVIAPVGKILNIPYARWLLASC